MRSLDLIHLQLALECKGLNSEGLLVRIPGPEPDEIARYQAYHFAEGWARYFRADVPQDIREQILALPAKATFTSPWQIEAMLTQHGRSGGYGGGTSYVFPRVPASTAYPDVVRLDGSDRNLIERFDLKLRVSPERPVHAVVVDNQIVSACVSARENENSAEAWVRTVPGYRQRGYARQTTAAWAAFVLGRNKIAFYSHISDNHASKAVAHGLALIPFASYVSFG